MAEFNFNVNVPDDPDTGDTGSGTGGSGCACCPDGTSTCQHQRAFTVADLIHRAKERADMEHSAFISEPEWHRMLNVWTAKLWSLLVKVDPDFNTHEYTIVGNGSTTDFELPTNYYGTAGVDYTVDSGQGIYHQLPRLMGREVNDVTTRNNNCVPQGYTFRYNPAAPTCTLLRVLPAPSPQYPIRHRYIVSPPRFATDGTEDDQLVGGIAGFEEYVIIGMAIDAGVKEKSNVAQLRQSQLEITQHLEIMAENRTVDTAGHIHDVREGSFYTDPADWHWYKNGA